MKLYRERAVVLRTHKLGEADRIITLLTRGSGQVRAVAKGIRKTTSKFGARLEPFMHVDLQLAPGRSLDSITQAQTLDPFARPIGTDYELYTCGTAMLETAERLVHDDEEAAEDQYLLLVAALRSLSNRKRPPSLVLDSYQLRAVSIAGFAPSFDSCASCGAAGPHRNFHAASGGIVCDQCRMPGSSNPGEDTVALLDALLTGDWPTIETADERARSEAGGLVSTYVSWHLERSLRSIPHVDR